jgi:hypothetical protein
MRILSLSLSLSLSLYIYIYREREREREWIVIQLATAIQLKDVAVKIIFESALVKTKKNKKSMTDFSCHVIPVI